MPAFSRPTALITGASGGIGNSAALRLCQQGWHVIVHAPTEAAGDEAVRQLVKAGADALCVDMVVADFASLADVSAMATTVLRQYRRLDALVNNAATAASATRTVTRDGNEHTFQVNYLAAYLLTRTLLPLIEGSGGRVTNVSSTLHRTANLDWSDPQRKHRYAQTAAYAQAKLALTMFTKGLAAEPAHRATAVAIHPGVVQTPLLHLYGRTGGPVAEAGLVVARMAAPETAVVDGGYYELDEPGRTAALVENRGAVRRLWKLSARLTGLESDAVEGGE